MSVSLGLKLPMCSSYRRAWEDHLSHTVGRWCYGAMALWCYGAKSVLRHPSTKEPKSSMRSMNLWAVMAAVMKYRNRDPKRLLDLRTCRLLR